MFSLIAYGMALFFVVYGGTCAVNLFTHGREERVTPIMQTVWWNAGMAIVITIVLWLLYAVGIRFVFRREITLGVTGYAFAASITGVGYFLYVLSRALHERPVTLHLRKASS